MHTLYVLYILHSIHRYIHRYVDTYISMQVSQAGSLAKQSLAGKDITTAWRVHTKLARQFASSRCLHSQFSSWYTTAYRSIALYFVVPFLFLGFHSVFMYYMSYINDYIHAYIHMLTYMHTSICLHTCIHIYAYMLTYIHAHVYIHVYIRIHTHAYIHAYIHIPTYMHTYLCLHTYACMLTLNAYHCANVVRLLAHIAANCVIYVILLSYYCLTTIIKQ